MKHQTKLLVAAALCLLPLPGAGGLAAQAPADGEPSRWRTLLDTLDLSVGLSTGGAYTSFRYTGLDDNHPSPVGSWHPAASLWLNAALGREGHLVVRPAIALGRYGCSFSGIGKNTLWAYYDLDDVGYTLDVRTLDFSLAALYRIGPQAWWLRPYAGVGLGLGFVTGGSMAYRWCYGDGRIDGYELPLSQGNFAGAVLSLSPLVGAETRLQLAAHPGRVFYAGVEASLDLGLTNTYSSDERRGKAIDVVTGQRVKVDGTRRSSALKLTAYIAIPLRPVERTARPATHAVPEAVVQPVVPPAPEPVLPADPPCYTLEEVQQALDMGEDVTGRVICAIDDTINFEFGESALTPDSYDYLDRLAQTLMSTGSRVVVKGHTDNVGSDDFNMRLSKKRAQSVVNYLVRRGFDRKRISYEYYGASHPRKSNDTDEGRAFNRRVEFEIVK